VHHHQLHIDVYVQIFLPFLQVH